MTDHDCKLLEFAAKSVGYDIYDHTILGDGIWIYGYDHSNPESNRSKIFWSPLNDDGDAIRLAVKLNIRLNPEEGGRACVSFWSDECWRELGNSSKECPNENMRRAIVRAAALIGMRKP